MNADPDRKSIARAIMHLGCTALVALCLVTQSILGQTQQGPSHSDPKASPSLTPTSEPMTPGKFFQLLRDIIQIGDLSRHGDVARVVGFGLQAKPWGHGTEFDPIGVLPEWIFRLEYRLNENEAPTLHKQYVQFNIKREALCITAQDVQSSFGQNYTLYRGPFPSFVDPKAEAEFWKEVREGPGIYGMAYQISITPKIGVGFYFGRRKCLDNGTVGITF